MISFLFTCIRRKKAEKKRDENQENCIHLTEKRRMMPEESYKFSLTFHHNFSFFLRLTPPTQQLSLSLSLSLSLVQDIINELFYSVTCGITMDHKSIFCVHRLHFTFISSFLCIFPFLCIIFTTSMLLRPSPP
jgi:hypothetical protein